MNDALLTAPMGTFLLRLVPKPFTQCTSGLVVQSVSRSLSSVSSFILFIHVLNAAENLGSRLDLTMYTRFHDVAITRGLSEYKQVVLDGID